MNQEHLAYAEWLAAGAEEQLPRSTALHASTCAYCREMTVAADVLTSITAEAEFPSQKARTVDDPAPGALVRVERVALAFAGIALLAVVVATTVGPLSTSPISDFITEGVLGGFVVGEPSDPPAEFAIASPEASASASTAADDTSTTDPSDVTGDPARPVPTPAWPTAQPRPTAPPTSAPTPLPTQGPTQPPTPVATPVPPPPTPEPTLAPTPEPTVAPTPPPPANAAPIARDDSYSALLGVLLVTPASTGVLANDSDADGDALTASLVDPPDHGVLVLNPNGSLTYLPDLGYTGPDEFTYRAFDGEAYSGLATVRITVSLLP